MKKYILIYLFIGWSLVVSGQTVIQSYEYWFNSNLNEKITETITPVSEFELAIQADASHLSNGVNAITLRFCDDYGNWSTAFTRLFVKMPEHRDSTDQKNIVAWEYQLNNQNSVKHEVTPGTTFTLNELMDVSELTDGVNAITLRFCDDYGNWSTAFTRLFVKMPEHRDSTDQKNIVAWEYQLNNENSVKHEVTPGTTFTLNELMDVSKLADGVNAITLRFCDDYGNWSMAFTRLFVKMPLIEFSNEENLITAYEYRIEDANGNMFGDNKSGEYTLVNLDSPVNPALIQFEIGLSQVPKGDYTIHFRALDILGHWSNVFSRTVLKEVLPVAQFSVEGAFSCMNTSVQFINQSIDADTCLWDFGDGQTSREWEPEHIFASAGQYEISLTVTDKATGRDSTISQLIVIHPEYHTTARKAICIDSTYRFGTQLITDAGVYDEMFQSEFGCDSLVTLTVQTVPGNIGVFDTTIVSPADECFNGFYTITVAGDGYPVTIEPGAFTNFIAGRSIHFLPGFHARSGSYVNAYISTEPWFCDQASQPIVLANLTPEPFAEKSFEISDSNIESENLLEQSMKVYPNPNNGIFTVQFTNFESNTQVFIFNALGQKVYETMVNGESERIELPNIQRGIYLLKTISGQKQFDRKVLVK